MNLSEHIHFDSPANRNKIHNYSICCTVFDRRWGQTLSSTLVTCTKKENDHVHIIDDETCLNTTTSVNSKQPQTEISFLKNRRWKNDPHVTPAPLSSAHSCSPRHPSDRRIFDSSSSDLLRSHLTSSHPLSLITMETYHCSGALGAALNSCCSEQTYLSLRTLSSISSSSLAVIFFNEGGRLISDSPSVCSHPQWHSPGTKGV